MSSEDRPTVESPSGSESEALSAFEVDTRPSLATERLTLRPFRKSDDVRVQELANDREIHANTRTFPFPYTLENAQTWLEGHAEKWLEGKAAVFAIVLKETGELVGAIGLHISEADHNAEIGYWLGNEYRNRGFCSEAAREVIGFGFEQLGLHRIHAHFMTRNPASGRVMEKAGMKKEGLLREHVRKLGKFEDIQFYGVLRSDWS